MVAAARAAFTSGLHVGPALVAVRALHVVVIDQTEENAVPDHELTEHARALLAGNAYLTLATVDTDGRPWTSPVYFAADGLADFFWVSSPQARHSRNLAARPAVSLVVFDSTVRPYHGRAFYAEGTAHEVGPDELDDHLQHYPGPVERGGADLTAADVTGAARWRFYRARATQVWVLCPREPRQACPRHGRTDDHRVLVEDVAGPITKM